MKARRSKPAGANWSANCSRASGRIISAPTPATRQERRSSCATSSRRTRRAHSSYPNVGLKAMVARLAEIRASHCKGRLANSVGFR